MIEKEKHPATPETPPHTGRELETNRLTDSELGTIAGAYRQLLRYADEMGDATREDISDATNSATPPCCEAWPPLPNSAAG